MNEHDDDLESELVDDPEAELDRFPTTEDELDEPESQGAEEADEDDETPPSGDTTEL
jgi:hypothetical protein